MEYFEVKSEEPFYILRINENKEKPDLFIFQKLNVAIQHVKKLMCKKINSDLIDLIEVRLKGDKFHIGQVGWDKIAIGIITLK